MISNPTLLKTIRSDMKTVGEEQSADQQSTETTRRDQPSNLIPHDKDHADDP
jgi:hypothetical protein